MTRRDRHLRARAIYFACKADFYREVALSMSLHSRELDADIGWSLDTPKRGQGLPDNWHDIAKLDEAEALQAIKGATP